MNKNYNNEEDNNVLRMLVNDLQSQLISMQNDMKTVREENTRLLSERSMSKNMMSDRMFSPSSPSNKSDSRGGNWILIILFEFKRYKMQKGAEMQKEFKAKD